MKVVHITTGYYHGGASIACKRLVEAQREIGINTAVITREKGIFPKYVYSTSKMFLKQKLNFIRTVFEKFIFLFYEKSKDGRFQYSIANTGEDIVNHPELKNADIIHLHWINAGFISLNEINRIVATKKPIVWTMHDIWPFTGGCHIAANCENYKSDCKNCFYLKSTQSNLSFSILKKKKQIYKSGNISFIAPSFWQEKRALSSNLLKNQSIKVIHNTVNHLDEIDDKFNCRKMLSLPQEKKLILFAAFNTNAKHKGINYLLEALNYLNTQNTDEIELVILGKKSTLLNHLNFKVHYLGYISSELQIRKIYKAADVFVTPSIEDNLPNTVLESLSVGTPVAAFKTGGIPEMVDHKKNGYIADFKNSKQLSKGIEWCLHNNSENLAKEAIQKINDKFSYKVIAKQFDEYYKTILNAQD